jgi:putative DNA primase/helicase
MNQLPLRERCRGKWYGILTAVGVDPSYLRNKHGPCPVCGGTDRFRWDDKNGDGTFYCNQCEPRAGSGIDLVMRIKGLSFRDAAPLIESVINDAPIEQKPTKANNTAAKEQARKDILNELWRFAKPAQRNDTVDRWLHNRGLDLAVFPSVLRHHPSVLHPGPPRSLHPAMIAMVQDPAGRPVTIHKTYLTADGQKAPVESVRMFMTGTITPGSAVRLALLGTMLGRPNPTNTKLGIAEGIETALACMKLFGFPCWAALTAGGIERFQPPESVETLMIMADNDDNGVGRRAAEKLAGRLSIRCEVHVPNQGKGDWNDVWKGARK